jgi:hypothetical protein
MAKQPKEPLKLMPLDEFGELVGKLARVPKEAVESKSGPKRKRRSKQT